MNAELPEKIRRLTENKPFKTDSIGMSGAQVLIYDNMVLKIESLSERTASDRKMLEWLYGKIPVPRIIEQENTQDKSFLLMTRAEGEMSCSERFLSKPKELVPLLAEAVKMLWNADISDCPRKRGSKELSEARIRVEKGLVDIKNAEPDTFGKNGFESPEALLLWLEENRPPEDEDEVLSHGDLCLPNIFISKNKISCFIDTSDAGIADKWRDISLCLRSLRHNTDGTYGNKVYSGYTAESFFDALEVNPDKDKLRYYLLLDELF